jgi:hypothetical protein
LKAFFEIRKRLFYFERGHLSGSPSPITLLEYQKGGFMSQVPPSKYIAYQNMVKATKEVGGLSGSLAQRAQGKKGKSSSFGSILESKEEDDKKGTDSTSSTRLARGGESNTASSTNTTETPESHVKKGKAKLLQAEALTSSKIQSDQISKIDVNPIKADD